MSALRREPEPGETLVRCARCGEIDLPLNERETWHYARTGDGLGSDCPKHLHGWHKWELVEEAHEPLAAVTAPAEREQGHR